ncbi:AbrB family transcriptional regulator [Aureimonas flava]|uniref:AbrB family transcriptional regulator n=1 Tax=Aureimonas flava TaxID=2320271 RepID=A0A3A1WN16_9HYPH|nr:AbrB family transcriptional regulator [Aureimonas flava]RIY03287.1 AbrB family transcriptional regulator [Aureimonas flava]
MNRYAQAALTIAIGAAGGGLAAFAGLPVAWLLGATVAVVVATLSGLTLRVPDRLRDATFFVLGIQAGSGVTPDVVNQLTLWPLSFAIQMVGVLLIVLATKVFLERVFGWDRETALFASLPGAMSFVLAAASETRADMTRIVVVQSTRLLLLIGVLTPMLAWLEGGQEVDGALRGGVIGSPLQYAILAGVSAACAWIGVRSRLPGGLILGALFASAFLHGTEIAPVAIPNWIAIPALVVLGCSIGARLRPEHRNAMVELLSASLGAFAIGLGLSGLAGLVALATLGIAFGKIALAYAPGALEALTVLAFQFNLDPAYVAAHHVVRFVGLALIVPVLARRLPRVRTQDSVVRKEAAPAAASRDTEND